MSHLDFKLAMRRAAGRPAALRRLYGIAYERVRDAGQIPWPALVQSWTEDMNEVAVLLKEAERRIKLTC